MNSKKIICTALIVCNLTGCATCTRTENTSNVGKNGASSTSVYEEESCESSNKIAGIVQKGLLVLIPIIAFGSMLKSK